MTFAQALARIEELSKEPGPLSIYYNIPAHRELLALLEEHADFIVQLGKVAEEMRNAQLSGIQGDTFLAIRKYDKLMNGGKDE